MTPRALIDGTPVASHAETRTVRHWRPRRRWLPKHLPRWNVFGHYDVSEYQVMVLDEKPPKSAAVFISYDARWDE